MLPTPTPASTTPVAVSTVVISVRNWELTVLKNRSIFPRPCGRYGFECVNRIPRRAQVRERFIHECASVIDVNRARNAASFQRRAEGRREADGVFRERPPGCRDEAGVVVEE